MLDAQETSLFVDNVNMNLPIYYNSIFITNLFDASNNLIDCAQILEDSKIARQQLSDIKSRHNDVVKLEKSIVEIRDMFAEMAFLIEKQVTV